MNRINNEFEYLLHLLRCVLENSQPAEAPESVSFERLFALAEEHSVANMAFYAVERLENKPETELLRKWETVRDRGIVNDMTQLSELELIKSAFSERKIRALPLKGSILKSMYPQTDMRTMSDIDILIDEENAASAREIMLSLGYENEHYGSDVDDLYVKRPVMNVEIHRELFGEIGKEFRETFAEPWELCIPSESFVKELPPEAFLAYVTAHAIKHYTLGGTGIRSFLDIWVYMAKVRSLDTNKMLDMLRPSGQSELAEDFITLSKIWFGGAESSEKYDRMTRYILSGGTYGTIRNTVENKISEYGRWGYLIHLLFPSMSYMKLMYPSVKKAPFL
ncbi:MAG: nucleotidyltransferase family protein, partial [Huintestinicola sp.]